MNATDTVDLLSLVAVGDRRTVGESDVAFWLGLLGDLRLDECKQAVRKHFYTSTDWLMPVHIRKIVIADRQDVAMRELPALGNDLIPMPDWFRDEVDKHKKHAAATRTNNLDAGRPVTFGEAIVNSFDRRPR